ncbi:hypothetical protein NBRC10513_005460 [Rhodotorula toruloides]
MSVAGSVSTASRRDSFVWTLSSARLHAELEKGREAGAEQKASLFSPPLFLVPVSLAATMNFAYQVKFRTPKQPGIKRPKLTTGTIEYSPQCLGWGWHNAVEQSLFDDLPSTDDLLLEVTLMEGKAPSPTHIPHALFNSPRYSDVAFHLVAVDAWIFSLKPVLVEKSTHLRTRSADTILDRDSARKAPSNLHAGDLDEFAELALSHKSIAADEDESQMKDVQSVDADEAAPTTSADALSEPHSPVDLLESSVTPASSTQRVAPAQYHRVEVADCSYSTFFSYLYWIYYDEISFAPSHAFALSAPETASPHDCSTIATFVETGSIDGAPPCDAHALYRLADRYLHNDLRDAAKNFIVESLTPETAAYEAFSSLGRTYTDVQDEIVKYIVKNLDAVRTSAGWTRALELMKDGQLVGGSVVLNKVLEGVVAAQEAK